MGNNALGNGLFQEFISWLYSSGDISIPTEFHEQCDKIIELKGNDISGIVNTLLDYSVNSSSETDFSVECSDNTLQELLNLWLTKINVNINGIPTGLQALEKEYCKERWESSFCLMNVSEWEKITVNNVTIEVPTVLYFVNGASIYIDRPKGSYKLGIDKFFLDTNKKKQIPKANEDIIVQKPFARWFDAYPVPYLVRKGVLKNWLAMKILQEKGNEVISKFLPYLFIISKGTENLFLQGDVSYSDPELQTMVDNFKKEYQKYKGEKGKTPTQAVPFDQKFEHLIPDLSKILTEELYRQGTRLILAGMGFIDLLEISPSRQESRLNPKPFISEINASVDDFKLILKDIIALIVNRNSSHIKLFNDNKRLHIINSPLKINVEQMLADIRSGFDRGAISIQSYTETLGFDMQTEIERRQKELDSGIEDLMYPHLIQNQEAQPDRMGIPAKPKDTTKLEDQNKLKNTPETKTKTAELEDELEIAPYKTNEDLPQHLQYLPEGAKDAFRKTFNETYPKGEDYAFPVSYTSMKRWLKKHGYKKNDNGKWVKAEENL